MNKTQQRLKDHFDESIQTKRKASKTLLPKIEQAGKLMVDCFSKKKKILACGNGGSTCDSLHFVCEIINRLERERAALPAVALTADIASITAIANDGHFDEIFARQIYALGNADDVLLAISTSGNSSNVLKAIESAHVKQMLVVALTGRGGGKMAHMLNAEDIEIRAPSDRTMRIQEVHELVIHALCDLIEQELFT